MELKDLPPKKDVKGGAPPTSMSHESDYETPPPISFARWQGEKDEQIRTLSRDVRETKSTVDKIQNDVAEVKNKITQFVIWGSVFLFVASGVWSIIVQMIVRWIGK